MILTKFMDSPGSLARATKLEDRDALLLLQSQYLGYVCARGFYLYTNKLREEKSGLWCCSTGATAAKSKPFKSCSVSGSMYSLALVPLETRGIGPPGAGVTDEHEPPDVWMLETGLRTSGRAVDALTTEPSPQPWGALSSFFPCK